MKKLAFIILLTLLVAGLAVYTRQQWTVAGTAAVGGLVEIPQGLGTRAIIGLLEQKKVISDGYAALAYTLYTGSQNKLQAGEYLFDRPMTIPEVITKLRRGDVYLHRFTIPEGLTTKGIAEKWREQGFGTEEEFLNAAADAVELVRRFDPDATSVEGYLFPETYSFPSHTTPAKVIEAMVDRFQQTLERLRQIVPAEKWPLNIGDTVILSSLVETEAAHADERPLIASVYLNRLSRRILLQCDPTVIYALAREDRYRGTLTRADLRFESPYNTYIHQGLPPSAIANPGYAALLAAIQPATTKYLFFVRTVESRHTFSETLAAHNRAVAAYRKSRRAS